MNDASKRAARRQHGAAMIELALVFPILTMLLFGFLEFGRALYQDNTLTKMLLTGARHLAREPDALDGGCSPGSAWSGAYAEAQQLVAFQADGSPRLPGMAAGDVTFSSRAQDGACVITANAAVPLQTIFGDLILTLLDIDSITLGANIEERYIGD